MKKTYYTFIIVILCFWQSCKNIPDSSSQVFSNPKLFNEVVFQLNWVVMGNNFSPIVASRNYVYAAIAAYEIMVQNDSNYRSMVGQLHGLNKVYQIKNKSEVNFNFAALLAYCKVGEAVTFPEGSLSNIKDSLINLATQKGMPEKVIENSLNFADSVSRSIIRWSRLDNYAQTRSAEKYNVDDVPGRWLPTAPGYFEATEPHWAEIRPLILDSSSQFRPEKPFDFNVTNPKSPYYQQVIAIKKTIENLSPEQKAIANFWDDNPFKLNVIGHVMFANKKFSPPGHWMGIVGLACNKANFDLDKTIYSYTMAAITMFDAFIHTWDAKYYYNTARPETIINKYFDANWRPFLQSPAFPEYTCGHSTISAAVAETLTYIFGENFNFIDSTETPFGIPPRKFNSFKEAALENNLARFYGGIHFHPSCVVSTKAGFKVGEYIYNKLKTVKTPKK